MLECNFVYHYLLLIGSWLQNAMALSHNRSYGLIPHRMTIINKNVHMMIMKCGKYVTIWSLDHRYLLYFGKSDTLLPKEHNFQSVTMVWILRNKKEFWRATDKAILSDNELREETVAASENSTANESWGKIWSSSQCPWNSNCVQPFTGISGLWT